MSVTINYKIGAGPEAFTFTGLISNPITSSIDTNAETIPIVILALRQYWHEVRPGSRVYEAVVTEETAKMCLYLLETPPDAFEAWTPAQQDLIIDSLLTGTETYPVDLAKLLKSVNTWINILEARSTPITFVNDGLTCTIRLSKQDNNGIIILKNGPVTIRLLSNNITRTTVFNLVYSVRRFIENLPFSMNGVVTGIAEYSAENQSEICSFGALSREMTDSLLSGVPITAAAALQPD